MFLLAQVSNVPNFNIIHILMVLLNRIYPSMSEKMSLLIVPATLFILMPKAISPVCSLACFSVPNMANPKHLLLPRIHSLLIVIPGKVHHDYWQDSRWTA